jgi:hypothetical protein
LVPSQ